jgi:ribulose-phosphate 3-epimerase
MSVLIAPSLLSADFLNLGNDIEMINTSEADWFHLDVMDGLFVPNISFGFPIIEKVKSLAQKPLDVHLMIIDPDRYIDRFRKTGADMISVHYESCTHLHRTVYAIRSSGAKAGVVLNPHSPVHLLTDIIPDIDFVLLMSVNPGFGGQRFIEQTIHKVNQLKEMILSINAQVLIEVDGGVDLENAPRLRHAGTDILVAGNTIFASTDPKETIRRLKKC